MTTGNQDHGNPCRAISRHRIPTKAIISPNRVGSKWNTGSADSGAGEVNRNGRHTGMMLDIDAGNPEWIHWSLTLGIAKRKRVSARMPVLCRVEKPDSMKFLSGREGEFLFTLSQRSWKISIDSPAFPRTNATRMFIFGLVSSVRSAGSESTGSPASRKTSTALSASSTVSAM